MFPGSRPWIATAHGAGGSLACHPFTIATGAECRNWVGIAPLAHAEFGEERAHIRLKRRLEHAICFQHIASLLGFAQRCAIYQQRFSVSGLHVDDALDHRLDLRFNVVRLVNHVCNTTGVGVALSASTYDFIEDAEEFKGVL